MKRAGMQELAQAAGVSLATVDRALNGRERLRPETLAHVIAVAKAMGHPAALRFGGAKRRLGVVLHKQGQEFYKAFADELRRAATEAGVDLVLAFSASQSPGDMGRALRAMAGRCDVLAATAVNHPEVTAAVAALKAAGIGVHALLSEFAPGLRASYLGLDNLKVGRIAGWMMQKVAAPGSVAIFVGGMRWHGHDLRDQGFRAYLHDHAPHLAVLEPLVNLETRQMTYDGVMTLLATRPDLRGIYVAGGGMEGAIAALRETRAPVALVVSALTPYSRRGLKGGQVTLVVDTPLEKLCRALMRRVLAAEGPETLFLPPDLHIAESL